MMGKEASLVSPTAVNGYWQQPAGAGEMKEKVFPGAELQHAKPGKAGIPIIELCKQQLLSCKLLSCQLLSSPELLISEN